jgi:UDPglucose 6-dehydrogenase
MKQTVSVVGLGKLGLCLAACFAKRGFLTIGVDVEENFVKKINDGHTPIVEPGLDELIAELGGKQLIATTQHRDAIEKTNMTFVLVATPSNPDGSFSNRHVESALKSLASCLKDSAKPYHHFVISSTVAPGSTESSFIPIIEKYSGRKLNHGFTVSFDPDFVALGDVIKGFLKPDLIIIGESSVEGGNELEAFHQAVCESKPRICRMSISSAEIAKVSLNAYITVKISFANMLANLCESVAGADVDAITGALGADKRISPYYLRGGLPYGGTCFPRDTFAFINFAASHGYDAEMIKAVEKVNHYQNEHLVGLVMKSLEAVEEKTVGILGLAFKEHTPVIVGSPAINLVTALLQKGVSIVAYDPLAMEATQGLFDDAVQFVSSAQACLEMSGVCVVMNRLPEYIDSVETYSLERKVVVVDCWRLIHTEKVPPAITLVGLGRMTPLS